MVVLQGGLIIVGEGQGVPSLDQEVVVEAGMLVVASRPVGGHLLYAIHGLVLQQPAVAQQHVCHLDH